MRIKRGTNRREKLLFPPSLEEKIESDNIIRLIDAFVDYLDLVNLGFTINNKKNHEPGAPQYHPSDLLKLYLYGYLNRTRSSRRLKKLCEVNLEVMWLLNSLTPGHVTIANFRKDHPESLKQVFIKYNEFLNNQDLFGKETIAIDGSKFRGQNSRKNNYNDKAIDRHEKYLDKKMEEYLALLDREDESEDQHLSRDQIKEKLEVLKERKTKYSILKDRLEEQKKEGQKQISTMDPDARLLGSSGSKGILGYNLQSCVDDKHCLIVTNELTNTSDQNALYDMASGGKKILGTDKVDALADSGYDTGEELMKCDQDDITTYVSPRKQQGSQKDHPFNKNKFIYDKTTDTYQCPAGKLLTTNGKWYTTKRKGVKDRTVKKYLLEFNQCNACEFGDQCAAKRLNIKKGRMIERSEYEDYKDANKKRVKEKKDYYLRRQAIVEHPFGTIKRQWGYYYTLLKGKEKVQAEFDLICLAYNIRRSVSILGVKELIRRLKASNKSFFVFFSAMIYTLHLSRNIFSDTHSIGRAS